MRVRVRHKDIETDAIVWDGLQGTWEDFRDIFKDVVWRDNTLLHIKSNKLINELSITTLAVGDALVFSNGFWLPVVEKVFHQTWDKCSEARPWRRTTDVDLLLSYGEWLDAEHLIVGDQGEGADKRTHEELAKEFLAWRAENGL
jgi:hypothetical protein